MIYEFDQNLLPSCITRSYLPDAPPPPAALSGKSLEQAISVTAVKEGYAGLFYINIAHPQICSMLTYQVDPSGLPSR